MAEVVFRDGVIRFSLFGSVVQTEEQARLAEQLRQARAVARVATLHDMLDAVLATGRKPTVPEMGPIVRLFYALPGNEVGGNLHVVLDDQNIGDGSIRWCREEAEKEGDTLAVKLADALLRCSKTQRGKLATGVYRGL